ncbi:hypothetical protein BC829DRAFT_429873 [Chytridium lagenaria]|nr:hypothetical protein BC829DRAFT_429873 [Chytridium lagenaria]
MFSKKIVMASAILMASSAVLAVPEGYGAPVYDAPSIVSSKAAAPTSVVYEAPKKEPVVTKSPEVVPEPKYEAPKAPEEVKPVVAEDKKPDETKPDEKKPVVVVEDKKPDETKPDVKKSDETKSDEGYGPPAPKSTTSAAAPITSIAPVTTTAPVYGGSITSDVKPDIIATVEYGAPISSSTSSVGAVSISTTTIGPDSTTTTLVYGVTQKVSSSVAPDFSTIPTTTMTYGATSVALISTTARYGASSVAFVSTTAPYSAPSPVVSQAPDVGYGAKPPTSSQAPVVVPPVGYGGAPAVPVSSAAPNVIPAAPSPSYNNKPVSSVAPVNTRVPVYDIIDSDECEEWEDVIITSVAAPATPTTDEEDCEETPTQTVAPVVTEDCEDEDIKPATLPPPVSLVKAVTATPSTKAAYAYVPNYATKADVTVAPQGINTAPQNNLNVQSGATKISVSLALLSVVAAVFAF